MPGRSIKTSHRLPRRLKLRLKLAQAYFLVAKLTPPIGAPVRRTQPRTLEYTSAHRPCAGGVASLAHAIQCDFEMTSHLVLQVYLARWGGSFDQR